MATKRMPPTRPIKQEEAPNKKVLYWIGGIVLVLIIAISVLLVVNG